MYSGDIIRTDWLGICLPHDLVGHAIDTLDMTRPNPLVTQSRTLTRGKGEMALTHS